MPQYRKKPVVIEAFRYGYIRTLPDWFQDDPRVIFQLDHVKIKTLEGTMIANKGDYIIKGIQGEIYPCKPDIFEATYELVEE